MNVVLFGASGMVGQGVLRECLLDAGIERVLSIGRSSSGRQHAKLSEIVRKDLTDLTPVEDRLRGSDACLYCLGVSSIGMTEAAYRRITHDLTIRTAETLRKLNPELTFVFVSGAGANAESRTMWARVKGETENALLAMPLKAAYMFRPGFIQPLHGIRSKTALYRALYAMLGPFNGLILKFLPNLATTTEVLGRAMIKAARSGAPKRVLESRDINAL